MDQERHADGYQSSSGGKEPVTCCIALGCLSLPFTDGCTLVRTGH